MEEEKEISKKHTQLPNNIFLEPKYLLVYTVIRSYGDGINRECFPPLQKIADNCCTSIPTIRACIKVLEEKGLIKIEKRGRKQYYTFNVEYDTFEPFSDEFLQNKDLTFSQKAYIVASQKYMFKENGEGKISYSNTELANKIKMSDDFVRKCDKELEKKGYLSIIKTNKVENGVYIREKFYHLDELGQAVVFTLQNHEDRLSKMEDTIESLVKDRDLLLKENQELKKKLNPSYKYTMGEESKLIE